MLLINIHGIVRDIRVLGSCWLTKARFFCFFQIDLYFKTEPQIPVTFQVIQSVYWSLHLFSFLLRRLHTNDSHYSFSKNRNNIKKYLSSEFWIGWSFLIFAMNNKNIHNSQHMVCCQAQMIKYFVYLTFSFSFSLRRPLSLTRSSLVIVLFHFFVQRDQSYLHVLIQSHQWIEKKRKTTSNRPRIKCKKNEKNEQIKDKMRVKSIFYSLETSNSVVVVFFAVTLICVKWIVSFHYDIFISQFDVIIRSHALLGS